MFKVLYFLLLLSVIFAAQSTGPSKEGRIIRGQLADIAKVPFTVSLANQTAQFCGGSIIAPEFVLTAGHCTADRNPSTLHIRAGTNLATVGGITKRILKVYLHSFYEASHPNDYDFAIIKVNSAFTWSAYIKPVALPKQDEIVPDRTTCFVMGWGVTQNTAESRFFLRIATMKIINQVKCMRAYAELDGVTLNMICAQGISIWGLEDSCQGLSHNKIYSNL